MGRNRGTRLSILWIHLHPVQPRSHAARNAALASLSPIGRAAVRAVRWRAPSHSITSSARSMIDGGTARPSALACDAPLIEALGAFPQTEAAAFSRQIAAGSTL